MFVCSLKHEQCWFNFRCFVYFTWPAVFRCCVCNRREEFNHNDKRTVWFSTLWHLFEIVSLGVYEFCCVWEWVHLCANTIPFLGNGKESMCGYLSMGNLMVELIINRHRTIFCHYQKWRPNCTNTNDFYCKARWCATTNHRHIYILWLRATWNTNCGMYFTNLWSSFGWWNSGFIHSLAVGLSSLAVLFWLLLDDEMNLKFQNKV